MIEVSPALIPGESIFASIYSCGAHKESDAVTVEQVLTQFRPPQIQSPVFEDADVLEITGAIPGATVQEAYAKPCLPRASAQVSRLRQGCFA
jgi:hypothetical protein